MIRFVSGHLDLTFEEFRLHYAWPLLEAAIAGDSFIVGDARGADSMVQRYLRAIGAEATVYHMLESPRNNSEGFPTIGGFQTDEERDEAMTAASDLDIAWVREGRGKSGTAKNLERRRKNAGPGKA